MTTAKLEEAGVSLARSRRIADTMRRFVDEGTIPGAITLLAREGRVVHFEVTGLMDREAGRLMERDAIFRIASMTKPITATAALMLFEEGHFLLDDPIANFLPEFAGTKVFARETAHGVEVTDLEQPISIRHLMTHTAGLTYDWYAVFPHPVARWYEKEQIGRPDEPLAEKVRRLAVLPLVHQPGAAWTYGYSYEVLGRLIEVISGQPLDIFLEQRIFAPLEMADTAFYVPPEKASRLAPLYTSDGQGGLKREDEPDLSKRPVCLWGGAGLVSTAADYMRFCQMLLNGGVLDGTRLLGRKTVELMTANQWRKDTSPFPPGGPFLPGYGYGLGVATLVDPAQAGLPSSMGEYEWGGALSTHFWIDPREQVLGVFMTQVQPLNPRPGWLFRVLAYQALV